MADSLTNEETVPKTVERGRDILETFAGRHYHGEPEPLSVGAKAIRKDLLADLMHEAEAAGEDISVLLERAKIHYMAGRDDDEDTYAFDAEVQVRGTDADDAREKAEALARAVGRMDAGSVFLPEGQPEIVP